MLWTVQKLVSRKIHNSAGKLTVEIANTQQTGGLEAGGQRVNNAVVVWRKKGVRNGRLSISRSFVYLPGIIDKL